MTTIQKVDRLTHLTRLRNDVTVSMLSGRYKEYKKAAKAYATEAIKDFELVKQLPKNKINIPIFSKIGLKTLKIWFLDMFRIKSKEEKILKNLAEDEMIRQKYLNV